jgi:hypothetical protein
VRSGSRMGSSATIRKMVTTRSAAGSAMGHGRLFVAQR